MVHEVGVKPGGADLLLGQVPGQLMHNGADHLQVPKFFYTFKLSIRMRNMRQAGMEGDLHVAAGGIGPAQALRLRISYMVKNAL